MLGHLRFGSFEKIENVCPAHLELLEFRNDEIAKMCNFEILTFQNVETLTFWNFGTLQL